MKKRRLIQIALIVFFVASIYLPSLLWLGTPEEQRNATTENRMLRDFPSFSLQKIETWPGEFETWFNDHIPFRSRLVNAYNKMQHLVFQVPTYTVLPGKEDYLFYNRKNDGYPIGLLTGNVMLQPELALQIVENLTTIHQEMDDAGIEFVVLLAPSKERMCAAFLPDYLQKRIVPDDQYPPLQLVNYLRENTPVRIVYPYEDLLQMQAQGFPYPLYYATDTHWNTLGGYVGSRALLEELGIHLPPLELDMVIEKGPYAGDLAFALNLTNELRNDVTYAVSLELPDVEMSEPFSPGNYDYISDSDEERRLLVVRDSYFNAMEPFVVSQFPETAVRYVTSMSYEDLEIFSPDVVVWELTERFFYQLANNPFAYVVEE